MTVRFPTSWVFALAALLLAVVTVDVVRAAPRATLPESIRHFTEPPSASPRVQAAVLLQASDCTGNLRVLHLLHRVGVRDKFHLAVIWFVGAPSDSSEIRRLLPPWTRSVQLVKAPRSVLGEMGRLGHRETPALIVFDQQGGVRFTTLSPRSPREFAGLQRIIEALTWIEEL